MGYDLYPNNKETERFHMDSAWGHLLEQCGAYFPCIYQGARWYMVLDERMTTHFHYDDDDERKGTIDKDYPAIICNCGFQITEEEAKVLARIARNYVAIQRTLPELTEEERNQPITTPAYLCPFPRPIRSDWIDTYEQFAVWAERSQGFKVF